MSLGVLTQDNFGGGIWRLSEPQKSPITTVYDAVNVLLDDQGSAYKRGGTATKTVCPDTIAGVADVELAAGQRTVLWSEFSMYVLDSDDTTLIEISNSHRPTHFAKAWGARGMAVFPDSVNKYAVLLYGGSRKSADYLTGTIATTAGSATVTGSGTSWLANVDAGMVLDSNSAQHVVQSVDSDTQLTLREGWSGASSASEAYALRRVAAITSFRPTTGDSSALCTVGTPGKVVLATGGRAWMSRQGLFTNGSLAFEQTDYHELPVAARTLGLESLRDSVYWFTSSGVWAIRNLNYDLTDDFGNVQQRVEQLSRDLILWGDPEYGGSAGVVGHQGGMIVPCTDAVYLLAPDGSSRSLSDAIQPLYQGYAGASNRIPGKAAVYRGHYLLPVYQINSGAVIDMLVLRLSTGAWTRWDGFALTSSLTTRPRTDGAGYIGPELYGTYSKDLLNLTGTMSPTGSVKQDVSSSYGTNVHQFSVTTRDFSTRAQSKSLWKLARLRYELMDAGSDDPSLTAEKATGPAKSSFTSLATSADEDNGTDPFEWSVDERAQSVRLRFRTVGPSADCRLRSLEMHFRQGAKR